MSPSAAAPAKITSHHQRFTAHPRCRSRCCPTKDPTPGVRSYGMRSSSPPIGPRCEPRSRPPAVPGLPTGCGSWGSRSPPVAGSRSGWRRRHPAHGFARSWPASRSPDTALRRPAIRRTRAIQGRPRLHGWSTSHPGTMARWLLPPARRAANAMGRGADRPLRPHCRRCYQPTRYADHRRAAGPTAVRSPVAPTPTRSRAAPAQSTPAGPWLARRTAGANYP